MNLSWTGMSGKHMWKNSNNWRPWVSSSWCVFSVSRTCWFHERKHCYDCWCGQLLSTLSAISVYPQPLTLIQTSYVSVLTSPWITWACSCVVGISYFHLRKQTPLLLVLSFVPAPYSLPTLVRDLGSPDRVQDVRSSISCYCMQTTSLLAWPLILPC